jgi:MOSC domain-containing protein YiiM
MRVLSVNVGRPRTIDIGASGKTTGIRKEPVPGAVEVTPEGLAGDAVCDRRYHGGVDQAVYVYGQADYDWWSQTLGRDLEPGTFGENLTISDLESARAQVGDRLIIGGRVLGGTTVLGEATVLEVTAPRIPCGKLAWRMGDPAFVGRFRAAERPGVYCRVIVPGTVRAGALVEYERYSGPTITMIEMFRGYYDPHADEATLRRHLAAPVAVRHRTRKEKELVELIGRAGERRASS